jgi:hypothetical protein
MVRGKVGDENRRPTNLIPARLGSLVAGVHVSSFYRWQKQYSNYRIPQRTDCPMAMVIVARGNALEPGQYETFLANGHIQYSFSGAMPLAMLREAFGQTRAI